jgi:hypothetical protein
MTARQRLIQTARDFKGLAAGIGALILLGSAAVALIVLVMRADPKGINDWGLLIGMFITAGSGMLTDSRQGQRATDPGPGAHVSTRVETETEP